MATISNSNYNSLVTGTATADSIVNTGGHVTIQALGGNDTVTNNNEGHSISLDGKVYVAIDGGAGDDSIQTTLSTYASIFGGDGNDSIESRESRASTLRGGDGNDYIYNDDYGHLSSIDGGAGADELHNSSSSTTIFGGAGDDSVYSLDRYCSINGGDGNDYIDVDSYNKNGGSAKTTVLGGAGNDFILTSGASLSIDGGTGDDELHNSGHSTTIDGGTGADYVHSTGKYCSINGGDNDDYIAVDGYSEDESDGDGSNTTILGGNGKDYIDNQGKNNYIDAGADNDYVWNRAGNVTINGGSGDDEIYDEFDFEGNANDVCIYAGAGNDTVYIQNPFGMIVGGAGNDHINLLGTSIFVPYASGDGNDTIYGFNESDLLTISGDSYSTQESGNDVIVKVGSGSILLAGAKGKSLHINVTQVQVSASTITLTEDSDDLYTTLQGTEIKALGGRDNIINSGSNVTIDGGTGDDLLQNENGANVLFTYANGDGNDEIYGFNETSTLSISGNAYSTQQSGDNVIVTVGDNSITLYNAASLSALHIDGEEKTDDTLTLTNDDAAKITLPAQIVTADATARTAAIRITGNALANSILGGTGKDTLYGGAGADSLFGGAGNDKLYGQTGNDYLEGGAGSDLLSGYTGDDTLYGGTANDTLTGGDGNDLFIYTSGKDVITDYEDGDKIALDAAISKSSVTGSDAIFTIGSSTLTVKNGKGKEIVFVDATGNERTIIGGAYLATDATASKATLAAWREVGDATERTKAVRLVGNELDNSILGGSGKDTLYGKDGNDYLAGNAGNDKLYGQNGNDTLWGGLGNDTLSGSTGADVFLYKTGEGKDVISGFANNDMLLITGAFTANVDASAKSIAFKVDSTADAITIKNYTATSFNINGFKYKISGSKLV